MNEEEKNNLRENLIAHDNNQLPFYEDQQIISQQQLYQNQNNIDDIDINFPEINEEHNEYLDREQIETQIRYTLKKSLKLLISQLIISFLKIITSIIILALYQAPCIVREFEDKSERLFLYLMIVYDFVFLIMNYIQLKLSLQVLRSEEIDISYISNNQVNEEQYHQNFENNQQEQDQYRNVDTNYNYIEAKYGIFRTSKDILEIVYLGLWIWGQTTIYFYEGTCQNNAPGIYYLIIVYIAFGFLSICFPIVILILACLCFPIIFLFALCMGRRTQQTPINKKILKDLKVVKYLKQEDREEECLICMVPYEENDEIIKLPCHEKHFFHAECIKKWLIINGICPVCRIRPDNSQK